MTDEQLATMNKALGLNKDKSYRPYCLMCKTMYRMTEISCGFVCEKCGNKIGFDLTKLKECL